jgi:hypothetical protein
MTVVEAVVGALLVLSVAGGFVLVDGDDRGTRDAALDREADDALTLLVREPLPDGPTLVGAVRSSTTFEANRTAVRSRLDALLPDGAFFRLSTPHGAIGQPRVDGIPTGHAVRTTRFGRLGLWVWYG